MTEEDIVIEFGFDIENERAAHPSTSNRYIIHSSHRSSCCASGRDHLGINAVHQVMEDLTGDLVSHVENEQRHREAGDGITPSLSESNEYKADQGTQR